MAFKLFTSSRIVAASLLTFVCILGAAVEVHAVNPSLGSIAPPGARRGGDVAVMLNGSRLKDFQGLLLYYPGITLKSHEVVGENQIKATFEIAKDCRLGNHAIRILTNSGISNLMLFSVGALAEVDEKEPNNEFDNPQEITLDSTVNGQVAVEDIDYFVVDAKKGERITAEVEGIRLGRAFFDPYVAILNTERFELNASDDTALVWHDAVASIVAPEDGKYIIAVRESSFSVAGQYRLHVGRFPRPQAVIPAGGKFGEKIELTWLGDAAGPIKRTTDLPKQRERYSWIFSPDNTHIALFAQDAKGIAPSPQLFRLGDLGNVIEAEPNNDIATATPFQPPLGLNGVISEPGDTDFFKFKAKKGEVYEVNVHARSIGSPLDSVLTIRRASNNQQLATNDDSGRPDSYLRFNAPADDEYVIVVDDLLKQGGTNFSYRVELTPVKPKLAIALPERQQYVDVTTSVPQGNRMAFMVSAQRRDFGGDLAIDFKNLPKGMSFETTPMLANQSLAPVLMTVAPDAPLGGALVDIVGKPTDSKIEVEGHLQQDSLLVRGNNNRAVFSHTAEFMATNVVERVPFKIEVVEPKVPLVRNGSMELKVRATRDQGFTAPIAVRFLYNPPGVSSSGGISIAEGQTEAIIPVTANSGAEIRSWKIAVIGEANIGGGNALVSSQMAKLDVVDSFFTFAFKPGAAEQGKEGNLVVTVNHNAEFAGKAKVELVGLPAEATAESLEFEKDTGEVVFSIKTTPKTPAGKHKSLICRATIILNGEPIVHTIGPTEFRVDTPLPPRPAVAAKPAAPAQPAAVAQAKPAAPKPLSRLEQLRQEKGETKQPADNKQ